MGNFSEFGSGLRTSGLEKIMHNLNMLRTALAGLGLGSLCGLIEAGFIWFGLEYSGDFSNLALVEIMVWGMIGVFAGVLSYLLSGKPEKESNEINLRLSLRILFLILFVEAGAQINFQYLPGLFHWKSIIFNTVLVLILALSWKASARVSSLKALKLISPSTPVVFWWLVVASVFILAVAATLLSGFDRQVEIRLFQRKQTEEKSIGNSPRAAVIGIDSATWDILTPLIEKGVLPNLTGLMRKGTWGTLTSYDYSASPVVWTSIFTGKSPELHGITDFPVAIASNRKVKSLWQIAEEHGLSSAVINVPGTYPVLGDCDVMLSGFPLPTASYTNRGWLLTTGTAATNRIVPTVSIGLNPAELKPGERWSTKATLKDLPPSFPSGKTAPALLLQRLASVQLSRFVQSKLVGVDFGLLNISITRIDNRFEVTLSSDEHLCTLRSGEWSDWLEIKIYDSYFSAKVNYLETDDSEISLYITPFYPYPAPASAKPSAWINSNLIEPYIAEGVGWQIFLEERLLGALPQHLTDVGRCRKSTALNILDQMDHELFVYIITMTDRIQHPMLKFMMPEAYRKLGEELEGDFARFQPTSGQVSKYRDVINQTYEVADHWLGEVLGRLDPETMVFIISDHGAKPGVHLISPTAGIHHPAGIYVMARAGYKETNVSIEDTRGPDLVLEDITPAVLHTLGLPVARDMGKTMPEFLLEEIDRIPEALASYESFDWNDGSAPEKVDGSIEEQLRSLGYLQ